MKYVIYGAGKIGHQISQKMEKENTVVCVVDSDRTKYGSKLNGYTVLSPDDIDKYEYDSIILCVPEDDISARESLVRRGISPEKISDWLDVVELSQRNTGTIKVNWEKGIKGNGLYDELLLAVDEYNDIEKFFLLGKHRPTFKWLHYLEIYHTFFERYYGKNINILEIGVNKGGSLEIWKNVFGEDSRIYGVDINPKCKEMEDERTRVFLGDQSDREFWAKVKKELPLLDIVIDDGGHTMQQQIVTFEELFPHIKKDGVYLCEDIGTSYDPMKYNSGKKKEGTFVEYSKNLIDSMHAWFSREDDFDVDYYTRSIKAIHYYFGVLVVEKKEMFPPFDMEICNFKGEKFAKPHMRGII